MSFYYKVFLNNGDLSPIFSSSAEEYFSLTSSSVICSYFLLCLEYKVNNVTAETNPAAAKDKDEPNPVGYFGFSRSKKMKLPAILSEFEVSNVRVHSPTIPPQLPIAMKNPVPIDRFSGPARLFTVQAVLFGMIGYTPMHARATIT